MKVSAYTGVEQMHTRRRGFTPTKKKGAGTIFYSSYWQKMGQPVLIRVGSTATGRCWILFLQVRAPIKPEAFASSNYISEHPDCLIHSFHYEMKAVSFHSFPFTLHKKRTFIGTHPSCPWEISSTSNIQSFEEKNNGAVSGCMQEEVSMCLTRLHKFCHLNAVFVSSNYRRFDDNRKTKCIPIKETAVKINRYTTYPWPI